MKCLVLGGGGFIGINLCERLLSEGHTLRVFERPRLLVGEKVSGPSLISFQKSVEWVEGDFTNPADIEGAVAGCDIIFHLICTTLPNSSNANPVYDIETNLTSTVKLLEKAREHRVRKIVFISSGGTVYGIPQRVPIPESHPTDPICSYGITKLSIEKYLHLYHYLYGLDYCILRVANPYGEHQRAAATQGAVAVFLHHAINREPIEIWGDGSVVRDYVYIGDVVDALSKAVHHSGGPRTFNIGSGLGHSLNDLIGTIESLLGYTVERIYKEGRAVDVPETVLDISNARDFLSWGPRTSFRDGLLHTLDFMRKQLLEL
jgi:UDP-glucose 4-epimerase